MFGTLNFCSPSFKNFKEIGKKIQPKISRQKKKNIWFWEMSNLGKKSKLINRKHLFSSGNFVFFTWIITTLPLVSFSRSVEGNSNKPFMTKTGLKILDFSLGKGKMPKWGDLLVINYVLYFSNSGKLEKIDSTYERNVPFLFLHGGGQVVLGLEEAVHDMQIGGKRRVLIPNNLGYSIPGMGPLPPSSEGRKKLYGKIENDSGVQEKNIVFDIEIVSIQESKGNFEWYNSNSLTPTKIQKIFD